MMDNQSDGNVGNCETLSPLKEPNGDASQTCVERSHPEDQNFFQRWLDKLKHNKTYRFKFLLSLALAWSFVCLGWLIGQFGPSFLDLRLITNNTPLEKATFFMTGHAVGYLLGSLVTGILFDRCNQILLVFFTVFLNIFVAAVIPWCSIYELMIVMQSLRGFFGGGLDVSGNALLVSTWGKDPAGRSFMQGLHFAFAMGGIISPLATAPFLAEKEQITNVTDSIVAEVITMTTNATPISHSFYDGYNATNNLTTQLPPQQSESRIYVAFVMSAVLHVTAAVPLFLLYLKSNKTKKKQNGKKDSSSEDTSPPARELPVVTKLLLLLSVSFYLGLYCAVEDSFNSLLATFCVNHLDWTKIDASIATSVFWAAFGFGRFLGIFLVKCFKPTKLIIFFCFILAVTFVGLYFSATYIFHIGIWMCCVGAGLGMSIVFPSVFTWTEENLMPVTGKVASAFLIAASSGSMINPILLGFLMDLFTPLWFSYLLLVESISLFLLFISLLVLARVIKNRYGNMYVDIKIEVKPDGAVIEEGSLLELEVAETENS